SPPEHHPDITGSIGSRRRSDQARISQSVVDGRRKTCRFISRSRTYIPVHHLGFPSAAWFRYSVPGAAFLRSRYFVLSHCQAIQERNCSTNLSTRREKSHETLRSATTESESLMGCGGAGFSSWNLERFDSLFDVVSEIGRAGAVDDPMI